VHCSALELGQNPGNRGEGVGEALPESEAPCGEGAACEPEFVVPRPVNVVTGDVFFSQVDAQLSGVRRVVSLIRTYSSQRAYAGIVGVFGRGWVHSYEKGITPLGTKLLRLNDGTGAPAYFQDADGDQAFVASLPITERSRITKSEGGYLRSLFQGGSETYDAQGRLIRQTDSVGNVTTLQRDESGRLLTIVVPGGRTLSFGYTGDQVTSLSGPDGLIASYVYDGDRLATVSYVGGLGYAFTYDSRGQVETVKDATGRTLETHTYQGDRGLTSEIADGQEKYTLNYHGPAAGGGDATVVTDATGNVTTYFINYSQAGLPRVYAIERTCSSCADGTQNQLFWRDWKGEIPPTRPRRSRGTPGAESST
jgi:YD repeat-containing protein